MRATGKHFGQSSIVTGTAQHTQPCARGRPPTDITRCKSLTNANGGLPSHSLPYVETDSLLRTLRLRFGHHIARPSARLAQSATDVFAHDAQHK
jgi:hypothetical protein